MENYKLTIEDGVITWVENADENGNPIEGILYIPKEAVAFHPDAWIFLGCDADGIVVNEENPVFSSAHNCLLSKDGKKLIKVCKNSDVSKLTSLEIIGQDAFNDLNVERDEFVFRIPDGVKILDYRAFAINARNVEIVVPSSVRAKMNQASRLLEYDFDDITTEEITTIKAVDIVIPEIKIESKPKIGFACQTPKMVHKKSYNKDTLKERGNTYEQI